MVLHSQRCAQLSKSDIMVFTYCEWKIPCNDHWMTKKSFDESSKSLQAIQYCFKPRNCWCEKGLQTLHEVITVYLSQSAAFTSRIFMERKKNDTKQKPNRTCFFCFKWKSHSDPWLTHFEILRVLIISIYTYKSNLLVANAFYFIHWITCVILVHFLWHWTKTHHVLMHQQNVNAKEQQLKMMPN